MSAEPKQLFLPVEPRELSTKAKYAAGRETFIETVLPVIRAAVERTGSKECPTLFDVQPSGLSEALTGTSTRGRDCHLEWLIQLLLWAPPATKHEIMSMLCDIAGCKPPERKEPITESEELRIARSVLRRYPGGIEMLEAEKDRYRP